MTGQSTEVSAKARRRTFPADYKRRIVREADTCTQTGAIGALLRREGLYSSHLTDWRRELERKDLAALSPKKRGPRGKDAREQTILDQQREIAHLTARAERAELVVEIQKKVSRLLGLHRFGLGVDPF